MKLTDPRLIFAQLGDLLASHALLHYTRLGKRAPSSISIINVHKTNNQWVVKEIGSGINDSRPKFLALLADQNIGIIVVEHRDRVARFGGRYIETLLNAQSRSLEIVNLAENSTEDLLPDLTAIIYSFCARLYGQRRAKRKTEKIVQELEADPHATG